jgi:NAD(P)-dependent dehydrogenase (short-subunit alcohol dehydrogenase family)
MNEISKMFSLKGRIAVITGGSSGIGEGCAYLFAKAGAHVFISARREDRLKSVCEKIEKEGGRCGYFAADLTLEDNCKSMVQACVERFGGMDVLVNSAGGLGANGDLNEEFSTDNYRKTLSLDLDATFWPIKHSYKLLSENSRGSIINIASLAALAGRGPIVYSAAKGAVRSMSYSMAKKLGKYGIRVNTIYPGLIITEMTEGILSDPALEKHFRDESPLDALGDVEDIAYCALYLASDAAKFVTGQDFVIDGGATL